jgi:hypothetical protein
MVVSSLDYLSVSRTANISVALNDAIGKPEVESHYLIWAAHSSKTPENLE